MKLAAVILASCLAFSGSARADHYNGPARTPHRAAMRAMLMAKFDRNHDGRLEPAERKRAAHALRKMARMLMRGERGAGGQGGGMRRQIIQSYALNRDGKGRSGRH